MNCPVCGINGPANARFCFQCGQPIDQHPTESAADPAKQETLHVATVLCAQVAGLSLADTIEAGPAQDGWRGLLEAIDYFGGTVIKEADDLLVASFGIPIGTPDHGPNAVLGALEMMTFFTLFANSFAEATGRTFTLRVGVHSGSVWRALRHGELNLTGEAVTFARDLCLAARQGQILMSETTQRLVREHVQSNPLPLTLEHQDHPLQVYELGARRPERADWPAKGTPFIGRQPVIGQLQLLAEHARRHQGAAVGITAEAGLGKTRLIHEFHHQVGSGSSLWLESRAQAWSQQRPNALFTDLLAGLLEVTQGEDPLIIQGRLAQRLHDLDRHAPLAGGLPNARRLALLAHLFGVPLTDSDDATAVRDATAGAIHELLIQEARRAGLLVLALDDLHWIDPVSLDTLTKLLPLVGDEPIVLLLGYRTQAELSERLWQASPTFQEILLEPLNREETEALMVARLPHIHLSAGVRSQILEATHGNPFYIEEVLKALTENGGLASEGKQWVTTERFSLPQTVRDLAATRLDNLGPTGKRVLQVASILGRSFATSAIRDLLKDPQVDMALQQLTQADLIVPLGSGRYIFRHNLTQEVAYATLDDGERPRWHGAAAGWIENHHADRLSDVLELLAWHYLRAGDAWRPQALGYLIKAADRAKQQGAIAAALHHWRDALRLGDVDFLPASARARILSQMGEMYLLTGETEQALEVYQDALKLVGSVPAPVVHRRGGATG